MDYPQNSTVTVSVSLYDSHGAARPGEAATTSVQVVNIDTGHRLDADGTFEATPSSPDFTVAAMAAPMTSTYTHAFNTTGWTRGTYLARFTAAGSEFYDEAFSVGMVADQAQVDALATALASAQTQITGLATELAEVAAGVEAGAGVQDTVDELGTALLAVRNQLDSLQAGLTAGTISISRPIAEDGKITLISGDDYLSVDSRALMFQVNGPHPELSGSTPHLLLVGNVNGDTHDITGTVANEATLRFEIASEVTSDLSPGGSAYEYTIYLTMPDGSRVTLATGIVEVL